MCLLCAAAQFPTTGYITFNLLPYNVTIGRGGVLVDASQGIAAVTIVKSPKEEGIYGIPPVGQWQGTSTYSSCCMQQLICCHPRRTALHSANVHEGKGLR